MVKRKRTPHLILEFSEFNLQRFNTDTSMVSVGTTTDPSLSVNAFDKFDDAVRLSMSKINTIMQSLSNTSAYRNLKDKLLFEDQKPKSIKIVRILPNGVDYNVYISFVINEIEYDGVITNLLSRNVLFNTSAFKSQELVQSQEWAIRLKGLILNTIKLWLIIEPGRYNLLNDSIKCFNIISGGIITLKKGDTIDVVKTIPDENKILIKYKNQTYNIIKDAYIYFNYWFVKEK